MAAAAQKAADIAMRRGVQARATYPQHVTRTFKTRF